MEDMFKRCFNRQAFDPFMIHTIGGVMANIKVIDTQGRDIVKKM